MIPEAHKGSLIYAEHMTRYLAAEPLVNGKVVLDIACGTGYGTKIMSENASKVYGVDIDAGTIEYAKTNYSAVNIEYLVGDGQRIPLQDNSIDTVVTFETIEHIKDYRKFIDELKRVLKPDGVAIVSTPNDLEFVEGNHFHLHEFKYAELLKLLKKDFKNVESYYQATWKGVAFGDSNVLSTEGEVDVPVINYSRTPQEQYLYFYLVCSNAKIGKKLSPVLALGEHYSDREYIGMQMTYEKNLQDYENVVSRLKQENSKLLERSIILDNVLNSRAYKLAKRISKAKNGLTRNGSKKS
jgi:ubiquinone/menaquinone biosynthesis C-methylase UbiE